MGAIDQLVQGPVARREPAAPSASAGVRRATVATAPDGDGLIEVVLDHSETLREPPCRYSPMLPAAEPAAGDLALVAFDENGEHYVTAWWPA